MLQHDSPSPKDTTTLTTEQLAPPNPESPLVVDQLVRTFGDRRALNGAGLKLHSGEMLALLGPNGAGKTTLIRCIAGRLRVESGTIHVLGRNVTNTQNGRSNLGIIPQHIAIFAKLTARENLDLFGRLSGMEPSSLKQRADWALDWTGLSERQNDLAETFSGGMKRRLNIACGILHQPDIVLLDEPTVGVDPQSRQRIWEMLQELQRSGTSILLTTHQLDEAQSVSDRIIIIDQGATLAEGDFQQLVDQSIGRQRRVTFTLSEPLERTPHGMELIEPHELSFQSESIVDDLEPRLEALRTARANVTDIRIEQPTLQDVFLHLTGRALRESDPE